MKPGLRCKLACILGQNKKLNRKLVRIKNSWDEVEKILDTKEIKKPQKKKSRKSR